MKGIMPSLLGICIVVFSAVCIFAVAHGHATAGTNVGKSFDAQAQQVVANLSQGNYADVEALFDATVATQLPQAALANAWTTYQQVLGSFQSAGQPTAVMRGDLTVEQVPVQLSQGPGEVRITSTQTARSLASSSYGRACPSPSKAA
jgi:hypothetical protein